MITKIYAKKFDGKEGENGSIKKAFVSDEDSVRITDALSKIVGVEDVKVKLGSLDPITYPIGWEIRGECNPSDLYQKVCNSGYSILRSCIVQLPNLKISLK